MLTHHDEGVSENGDPQSMARICSLYHASATTRVLITKPLRKLHRFHEPARVLALSPSGENPAAYFL